MPAVATGILVSFFSRKCWTIGITFSCSLLHEPMHVTKGKRFVLLAFLYGES